MIDLENELKIKDTPSYLDILQNKTTSVFSTFTSKSVEMGKTNLVGERVATLTVEDSTYKNDIKISTNENQKNIDAIEHQLKTNRKLPKEQKKDLTKQLKELQNNVLDNIVSRLSSTRFVDVFQLLLTKMADARKVVNVEKLELDDVGKYTRYSLAINDVCRYLGIQYSTAFELLENTGANLKHITLNYTNKKAKDALIKGWFTILQSFEVRKNIFTFEFSNKFAYLMLKTGNIRPTLFDSYNYNAKELKFMGQLRYYLENVFYTSMLNAGQYKKVRLINLVNLSNVELSKNPKRNFIDPLKIHLSKLMETGLFKCKFTMAKGATLPKEYVQYLDVNKDGTLKTSEDIEEISSSSKRVKINELLNSVMLSYTFVNRPIYELSDKNKKARANARRAKTKAKNQNKKQ